MEINEFSGDFYFLNNFSDSPIHFFAVTWPTLEHLYQASKTSDTALRESIRLSHSPAEAKQLGRKIKLSRDWEKNKKAVMLTCVRLKFQQNIQLRDMLIATDSSLLIEGNDWHDNTWGNCVCDDCQTIPGKNLLGNVLMQVRHELMQSSEQLTLLVPSPSSRFFPSICEFLQKRGIDVTLPGKTLINQNNDFNIVYCRGFDIPFALACGYGDLGITGLDAVVESQSKVVILERLGIRFSEVVLVRRHLQQVNDLRPNDTIVTEYKNISQDFFERQKIYNLNYIPVKGAAEAYAFFPEVSAIITLKTTGQSLFDNNLKVVETIFKTEACVIANKNSMQKKSHLIQNFLQTINSTSMEI
jgi:ATP phosphoribosyltransferase